MEELINRIGERAGVPHEAARQAVSVFISYLDRSAPRERMADVYAAVPGVESLVVKQKGGLFGFLNNGLTNVYSQLSAAGFSSQQMQWAGEELLAFAREKAGAEAVDDIIASVPQLRQLF
ncbi:MAG: hypothetical protein ACWA6X_04355 [Bauldia sp.]|jgi:hypothetical protein